MALPIDPHTGRMMADGCEWGPEDFMREEDMVEALKAENLKLRKHMAQLHQERADAMFPVQNPDLESSWSEGKMIEASKLLSRPYNGPWFPAKQSDGNGFMIVEIGAVIEPGKSAEEKIVAVDMAQVDADAICITHNRRGKAQDA